MTMCHPGRESVARTNFASILIKKLLTIADVIQAAIQHDMNVEEVHLGIVVV